MEKTVRDSYLPKLVMGVLGIFFLFMTSHLCGRMGPTNLVVEKLQGCAEARDLLGGDIRLSMAGVAIGCTIQPDGGGGEADWSLPVVGTKGAGRLYYTAEEDSRWFLESASLRVDGNKIDLLACTNLSFDGEIHIRGSIRKSTRSNFPSGQICSGKLLPNEKNAHVVLHCGDEGTLLYDGTGPFEFQGSNNQFRFDDSEISTADGTPSCKIVGAPGQRASFTVHESTRSKKDYVVIYAEFTHHN